MIEDYILTNISRGMQRPNDDQAQEMAMEMIEARRALRDMNFHLTSAGWKQIDGLHATPIPLVRTP